MFHLIHILLTGPLAPPAYLDPGSGSFLVQMLIAAVLGIAVAVRASWGKIRKMLGLPSKETEDEVAEKIPEVQTVSSPSKIRVVLPTNCHSCGAIVRSNEIKWLDDLTAQCNYCGASIRATKEK